MEAQPKDSCLIDALGGTGKVAALCGLTPGAVSQWRTKGIPKAWKEFLRLAKPEVFKAWKAMDPGAASLRPARGGLV